MADIEQRAWDKINKKKVEKTIDEQVPDSLTEKERLIESLSEETKKLNICKSKYDDWSSMKAKDLAKIVSEETAVETQQAKLCRHRENNREEIARLELEQKELARHLIDTDSVKRKLGKKKKKSEELIEEKLYEHNIEKAKILDSIQKIQFELSRIDDHGKN